MSVCPTERFTLEIGGSEVGYLRIHYVKSHPSVDPDTFDIKLLPEDADGVDYFDSVEVKKDGVTEFYGFIEEITPQVSESGLEYLITGRCWKLITWKKYTERYVETREVGPNEQAGFFGKVYPPELICFLLRTPVSIHPSGKVRHKIGWGIHSDDWICAAIRTATGHHPVWVATRRVNFEWQLGNLTFTATTLAVDGFDNTWGDWTRNAACGICLDDDDVVNYISAVNLGDDDGYYTFADLGVAYKRGSVSSCILHIKGRFVDDGGSGGADTVQVRAYLYFNGVSVANNTVTYTNGLGWEDQTWDISANVTTIALLNALKVRLEWAAATNPANQHPDVTYMYVVTTGEQTSYQTEDDWFAVDLGAAYQNIVAILIESRNDLTETQFARHLVIEYNTAAFVNDDTPPAAGWVPIRWVPNNVTRDILLSWEPLDGINVRCIRIRITADIDFGWEISQIYIWQADTDVTTAKRFRLVNEP